MASSNAPFSKRSFPANVWISESLGLRASLAIRICTYVGLEISEGIISLSLDLKATRTNKICICLGWLEIYGNRTVIDSF